jgi:hypothetical protein
MDLDVLHGRAQRVFEQLARKPPVRGPGLVGAVVGHPLVETDDGVQVHQAAVLVLGDLDVGDADLLAQCLLGDARVLGELAGQVDRQAAP